MLVSPWGYATASDWNIFPSTCITDKPGELCRLHIQVEFPPQLQSQPTEVCFFVNQQRLRCALSGEQAIEIAVEITRTSELTLVLGERVALTKALLVQSRVRKHQRRRVRNPWSFF